MRRAGVAAALAVLCASAASAQTATAPAPPPPNAIAPLFTANVPVLFQWTAVNPGTVYNLIVSQRGRNPSALTLPQVTYELQIGDHADVMSHILFDLTVPLASYLFTNQYVPNGGFTSNEPFGVPLSGGQYYWRVRGIVGGVVTAFSAPQAFTLQLPAGGGGSTPIHAIGITGLSVPGQPLVNVGSAVLLVVQNLGTFTESGVPYQVNVNGTPLFNGQTGSLAPGQSVQISRQWTPAATGTALVTATVTFVGAATQARTNASLTVIVDEQAPILTTIVGTVRRSGSAYVLVDSSERALAVLVTSAGSRVDLPSYVDERVTASGSLTKTADGYVFSVRVMNATR